MAMNAKENTALGKRLDMLIKEKYSSREKFAKENNLSKTSVDKHCNGQNMNVSSLMDYAEALGVSTDYLIYGKGDGTKNEIYKNENQVSLGEIHKAILLLDRMFCQENLIQVLRPGFPDESERILIEIDNDELVSNIKDIKNTMQAMENSNSPRTKEALKNALEDMIDAENVIVEKCFGGEYIYDKTKEIIFNYPILLDNNQMVGFAKPISIDRISEEKRKVLSLVDYYNKMNNEQCGCSFEYDEDGHLVTVFDIPITAQEQREICKVHLNRNAMLPERGKDEDE